jgi:diguanylate cyclase (GGDEF)-like protein
MQTLQLPIQRSNLEPLILVVDDDWIVREQLRLWLEQEGYAVAETENGAACLEAYNRYHPDLVLLDVSLPDRDGFLCCEQLYSMSGGEHTPILMMSTYTDDPSIAQAFELGVSDYIVKPIHWGILRHRLQRWLMQSHRIRCLEAENRQLTRLAMLDSLTRIPNRRQFDDHLDAMWRQMIREDGWLSVVLGDVDFFKSYNDTYGHLAGDKCLHNIAQALKQCCRRPLDMVTRYGGEEFGIILPQTDLEGALALSAQMSSAIDGLQIPHLKSKVKSQVDAVVTMSFGVATVKPEVNSLPDVLLEMTDAALYQAKDQGRHRVVGVELQLECLNNE